jgi:hypothetical protein
LRKALKALVYSLTVGSLHGRFGHADPRAAKNEISGSVPVASACASHWSSQTASVGFRATFHEGK